MVHSVVKLEPAEHPMEEILDIEPGTTIMERVETLPSEIVAAEEYDNKDNEIEKQFQEVYDSAMTAFEYASETTQVIEPKYRARNEEIAVQYLNTALAAAREKAMLKQHKDKVSVAKGKAMAPKTVNNNLIVADRNEILKSLRGDK